MTLTKRLGGVSRSVCETYSVWRAGQGKLRNQKLTERFGERFRALVTLAKKLDMAIGESITSQDLFVFAPSHQEAFSVVCMAPAEEGSGTIACTCELGLGVSHMMEQAGEWKERRVECW